MLRSRAPARTRPGRPDPRRRPDRRRSRPFSVGANLKSWAESYLGKPNKYSRFGAFKDAHDRLREIGKPTLARINGVCVGGGNELQMACDLAVMADDTFHPPRRPGAGSVPAGGATQWLTLFVGERRAREIVLMCEPIPAKTCEEWGLVNWAVPGGGARREGRRGRREPCAQAAADDPLRKAAPELLEGPRVARDDQPRARLARVVDGDRGAAGRGEEVSREERWLTSFAKRSTRGPARWSSATRPRQSSSSPRASS